MHPVTTACPDGGSDATSSSWAVTVAVAATAPASTSVAASTSDSEATRHKLRASLTAQLLDGTIHIPRAALLLVFLLRVPLLSVTELAEPLPRPRTARRPDRRAPIGVAGSDVTAALVEFTSLALTSFTAFFFPPSGGLPLQSK